MAATLTDELTRVSVADIEKWEEDGDTLYVYGRCTTPEVDTDDQVVDSSWSGSALKEYLATAPTVRVQHNAQRDPAGSAVRVDVNRDGDGAHWLKAAVDEPIAQRLVKKGHLRAFSVGIARPLIERDVTGKARGGIIRGGKVVEVSLVDSPANRSCFLELSKADKTGACEFTGKLSADDDFLQKALGDDLLTKDAGPEAAKSAPASIGTWTAPEDLSITFTPADMARLVKSKFVEQHYAELAAQAVTEKRDFDRGVGGGVDRDKLPDSDFAGPHRSFPIVTQSDVSDALGLAGHADDPEAVRARIHAIARRKGFSVPDDDSKTDKGAEEAVEQQAVETPGAAKEAEPELTKDPEPEDKPKPVKKAKKKPKKLPPWLSKPSGDGDGDSDDDDGKADKAAHCGQDHEHTDKCHTDPATAAGVTASPMKPAPVPDTMPESPAMPSTASPGVSKAGPAPQSAASAPGEAPAAAVKASPEVAALMRFRAAGIDPDLGKLHDFTCPAYHPDDVQRHHPFDSLAGLVDERMWQRKALNAATGPLEQALRMHEIAQAALTLKQADQADLNDYRLELHKAFRDANPGPATYPTPGSISPQRFSRPCITEGHAAESPGYGPPNTSPQVATTAPDAHSFDRPPLSAGHQTPSPSHMKASFEYPSEQGVPTRITYAQIERDKARRALSMLHDHINHMFPSACPILDQDAYRQPEARPVPQPAGIGKAVSPESAPAAPPAPAAAFKAEPEEDGDFFADAEVYKAFKKMKKKLGKRVLSGKMTVDEARAKLGRQFTQKGIPEGVGGNVQKSAGYTPHQGAAEPQAAPIGRASASAPAASPVAAPSFSPEDIEAAVTKAVTPLLEKIQQQDEAFTIKLAEQQRVIDAIADQPDPSTAAFAGLAFNPLHVQKSRRPAGVIDQAEAAARAQQMIQRELETQYNSSSDPAFREATYATLTKMRGAT